MKRNEIRDNAIQLAALVAAVALGYRIRGWAGAAAGFLLFAVVILLTVRQKMARAQEIGKARRAARLSGAAPWSNIPDDPTSGKGPTAGNDDTANGS